MHQMSAAGIAAGTVAALGAWDIRECKAGCSSEQCHEAGGRSSREKNTFLHCIHPVLYSCSAHFGAGHKPCVPTLSWLMASTCLLLPKNPMGMWGDGTMMGPVCNHVLTSARAIPP